MPKLRAEEEEFEVPLTPLIDVVFLLLIFFLVATNFTRKEIDQQVKLPKAEGGTEHKTPPKTLVLNVRRDGTVVIEGRIVEPAKLRERLVGWHKKYPDLNAMIRADADVPYKHPMRLMGLCKSVGIEAVDLPVEEPGGGGE